MRYQRHYIINSIATIIIILLGATIITVSLLIRSHLAEQAANDNQTNSSETSEPPRHLYPKIPTFAELVARTKTDFIDLQPVVDNWLSNLNPNVDVGLMIYDLTNSKVAASFQADKSFDVASVYKLLFAYDGYHQIALGADDGEAYYTTTSEKGDLTLYQCLDLTIRESYNGCADKLASDSRRVSRVNALIRNLGMTNTRNRGLTSTASDLTKLLRTYWRHTGLDDDSWSRLSDSLLNQPPTQVSDNEYYDWRQGLPAGFSDQVLVYDKVGWDWNEENKIWNIYADAAILEFTQSKRVYTIAVLTRNLTNYRKLSELGTLIESAILNPTN